jgi:hypothetical protein
MSLFFMACLLAICLPIINVQLPYFIQIAPFLSVPLNSHNRKLIPAIPTDTTLTMSLMTMRDGHGAAMTMFEEWIKGDE